MGRASHLRARHMRASLRSDDLGNGFSRLQASNVGTNREQRNCASEVWHSLRIAPARNDLRTEPSRNRRETTSGPSIGCVHGYLAPVFLGIGHKFSQAVPPARFVLQASASHKLHQVVTVASSARKCWTFAGLRCARCLLVGCW
jgi:hypothetical protein